MDAATLESRFLEELRRLGVGEEPTSMVVALSGGCDSTTLLYLLRFVARGLPLTLAAAHLDHAMRPESAGDARWVAGLCTAWGVPLVSRRLPAPPAGETAARRERRAFLREVAERAGATLVATAHHADDQAETVLFRALRGTGPEGLRGIRARTADGLVRPLLPFWREEIQAYAAARGVRWRVDATNLRADTARNRIRLELLPVIEATIAPAARRNLVRLAALAEESEAALAHAVRRAERRVVTWREGECLLARVPLRAYDSATASRLLRNVLRRFGVVPDRPGTRTALQFITHARSGRRLELPGGVRVSTEYDVARIAREREVPADTPLLIAEAAAEWREGRARIGGAERRVRWRTGEGGAVEDADVSLPLPALRFPLTVRGWLPGDRMRTRGGTKTLKKAFAEERLARSERGRTAVVADATGAVVWVAGLSRQPLLAPDRDGAALFLAFPDD